MMMILKRVTFMLIIGISISFITSCRTTSVLVTKDIQIGMTKNQIMRELGMPFKRASSVLEDGTQLETFYYKEDLYIKGFSNGSRVIENILYFEDDILVEIAQGEEYSSPRSRSTNNHYDDNE